MLFHLSRYSITSARRLYTLNPSYFITMVKTRRASALALSGSEDRIPESPRKKVKLDMEEELNETKEELQIGLEAAPISSTVATNTKRVSKKKVVEIDKSKFLKFLPCRWKVGAHVSTNGGVENAVANAAAIGANAFALFVKSQRKWISPPLQESSIATFKSRMEEYGYTSDVVLPHGSYLINLGNPDAEKREKSYQCFLDDLKRCEALGLGMYNFHPGSTVGATTTEHSLSLIAECLNRAHRETTGITTVLENMAGAGNVIGGDFAHLAGIIEQVEDKSRVGVCMDTCHAFAAGYDIRTKENWDETMSKFDSIVGLSYLRGMHLNDSKAALGTKRDRHENIGLGHICLLAFNHILTDPRTQGIPMILETNSFEKPKEVWGKEIEVLHRISGDGIGVLDDEALGALKGEVEAAIRAAGGVVAKVREKVVAKKRKGKGKKGVKEDEEEDVEEENNNEEDEGDEQEEEKVAKKTAKEKKAPARKGLGRKKAQ